MCLIHVRNKGEVGTVNMFKPSSSFLGGAFCGSFSVFWYWCPDEGLCKTETRRLPINYVPLTVDYCWFCSLFTLLFYLYLCFVFNFFFVILTCLFLAALWSPTGKGLASWPYCIWCFLLLLSLSNMVSWVRCGTWLYRFLIFAASFYFF